MNNNTTHPYNISIRLDMLEYGMIWALDSVQTTERKARDRAQRLIDQGMDPEDIQISTRLTEEEAALWNATYDHTND